jgi:hypothetical protein
MDGKAQDVKSTKLAEIKAKGKGFSPTKHHSALIEFGKNSLINSVSVIHEHMKLMIPLTTGLITAYFALLEFLGVKSALDGGKISASALVDPTLFMLGSLIVFIITSFPILKRVNLANINSIISYRNFFVAWRYIGACIGMALFLYAIFTMIYIFKSILEP